MTAPFMDAYVRLLIKTCHKRGVHAMGGMRSFHLSLSLSCIMDADALMVLKACLP